VLDGLVLSIKGLCCDAGLWSHPVSRGWFAIWFANSAHELMSAYTVKGEQMATVEPESLEGLADVVYIREADDTWPQFFLQISRGCPYPLLAFN
jgi:hypothetical protein